VSAVSRKHHGNAGDFDIDLPLTGDVGIEDRQGNGSTREMIVFTFSEAITSVDSASTTCGSVGDGTVDVADVKEVRMHVGRKGVDGTTFRDDVTVDGKINHADVNLVKANLGNSLP